MSADIVFDGGFVGTLGPGQSGFPMTGAAGVGHPVQWRVTNTNIYPCAAFVPVPVDCSTPIYQSCVF